MYCFPYVLFVTYKTAPQTIPAVVKQQLTKPYWRSSPAQQPNLRCESTNVTHLSNLHLTAVPELSAIRLGCLLPAYNLSANVDSMESSVEAGNYSTGGIFLWDAFNYIHRAFDSQMLHPRSSEAFTVLHSWNLQGMGFGWAWHFIIYAPICCSGERT